MTQYCLDTSALIEGWVRSYPKDSFPSLWAHFDEMIENGSLLCPDEVIYELEKKADDLYEWAKQRDKLFYPLDVSLQTVVTGEKHSGNLNTPRIPDVCDHYGIRCINLLQLIREQKWYF